MTLDTDLPVRFSAESAVTSVLPGLPEIDVTPVRVSASIRKVEDEPKICNPSTPVRVTDLRSNVPLTCQIRRSNPPPPSKTRLGFHAVALLTVRTSFPLPPRKLVTVPLPLRTTTSLPSPP